MIAQLLRIGMAGSIGDDVAKLEKTDTGKFALGMAKGTIIVTLVLLGVVTFIVIRSMNRTFGKQKTEIAGIKKLLIGMQQIKRDDNGEQV